MKIICTTSNNYHHLLPIFFYLYGKYWNEPFDLVGHAKPECELPDNCTWVSLGPQGAKTDFSTQLRPYFEQQPGWFVWMMEDTVIKDKFLMPPIWDLKTVGRYDLTKDIQSREHTKDNYMVIAHPNSRYRLSTQPSIWNKEFLLQYLTPGLSPWDMETQDPKNDGWTIAGWVNPPLVHNEGVRKFNIYKLNTDGVCDEDLKIINELSKNWRQ